MITPEAQQAFQFYVQRGMAPHQAAALVGRFMVESTPRLNPTIVGDRGASLGVGQWRDARRTALQQFAAQQGLDPSQRETQLMFAQHELAGPEKRAGSILSSAKDVQSAVNGAMAYERPQGFSWGNPAAGLGYQKTLAYAQALLGQGQPPQAMAQAAPAGQTPPPSPAPSAPTPSAQPSDPMQALIGTLARFAPQQQAPPPPDPAQQMLAQFARNAAQWAAQNENPRRAAGLLGWS